MTYRLTKKGWTGFCDDCGQPFRPYLIDYKRYSIRGLPYVLTVLKAQVRFYKDYIGHCEGCFARASESLDNHQSLSLCRASLKDFEYYDKKPKKVAGALIV
jgi:hypothetical protein